MLDPVAASTALTKDGISAGFQVVGALPKAFPVIKVALTTACREA
jgi:hypothetical protein